MSTKMNLLISAALAICLAAGSAAASPCTNDAVPGSSPTRSQWQTSGAGLPANAYFRFTIFPDGTFQGRNILDVKPSQQCTTWLYAKLDLGSSTSPVYFIKRKRTRSKILTLKAAGLPPVSTYRGEVPILNLQTKTVCPSLEEDLKSNVYARYLRCGAAGKQAVGPKRYPSRLSSAIR